MHVKIWFASGIRLLAIYMVIEAFASTFSGLTTARSLGIENNTVYLVNLMSLLIALSLWLFPMTLASKIVPSTEASSSQSTSAFDLAKIGCGLLSIYLIISNLWSIVLAVYFIDSQYYNSPEATANLTGGILSLVFGFILLVNSSKVANLLCRKT